MQEYYEIEIAGLKRQLPICPLNDKLSIAGFVMFSDVEITIATAKALIEKLPEHDIIVTAEAKGIPLAYEMSRQEGKKYIVMRKRKKAYMKNPLSFQVQSITTQGIQTLYLDEDEANLLKGKRVVIVDDVISTGESLNTLEVLVGQAGGNIVAKAAVLAEGDACKREDIIYLQELPLFFH